jgi:translocation and assembly module TamB
MNNGPSEEGVDVRDGSGTPAVARRSIWSRIALIVGVTVLALFAVAILVVWTQRRPIAGHYLKGEFERRGVRASYHLDRVGFRTQEVSNLVIGDPKRPDLTARHAIIQIRLKLDGNFAVYRVVARGVRLRGRLIHGKVSWGAIDKLLPPPSNTPFQLPDIVLDVADSSIALATPFGPVGVAAEGNGRLSGGFKGHLAVASARVAPGKCEALNLHVLVAVAVVARHPQVEGPVTLGRFSCPVSHFNVVAPRFDAKATFNEAFTKVDGGGRMAIVTLDSGVNSLADFDGNITYKGSFAHVDGNVRLAADKSRMATATADRTQLHGRYHLGIQNGTFGLIGDFAADNSTLDPKTLDSITQPLSAAAGTPIGPVVTSISDAIGRTASRFNASGQIRVVNFPGGGAARITRADVIAQRGARAHISGGTGITYYWPAKGLRVDGNIEMAGGGLPSGRVTLHQLSAAAPMSGVADLQPYVANGQRLALTPVRFGPGPGGSTALSTVAQLDGAFPNGRVQALRLPIDGRIGPGSSFAIGTSCAVVSVNYLQMSTIQLGPTRLPVCPIGPAIISKPSGGKLQTAAQINAPVLDGKIGSSPLHLRAASGQLIGNRFDFSRFAMALGRPTAPILFDAARLNGAFIGSDVRGNFAGGSGTIGKVPLALSDAAGTWLFHRKDLNIDGALTLSDRDPDPRFYPLRSKDLHFSLAGDYVHASGTLRFPVTGTEITQVTIEHHLSSGGGAAVLDVPGIAFGPNFQPDQLTRLSEGVVALVNGTVRGQGRIEWGSGGKLASTGEFTTANMDLAAPFGPVTGFTTKIHFTDLLGLTTAPHQIATAKSVNPGITVTDGVIQYQILPHDLVKIERGEWPFMGGRLILQETILNFGSPSAKRLTFQLDGFDAKQFVDSLGFQGFELTGKFDGVLPMIFDENGGRIVGGRLDSRAPGGQLKYSGTKPGGLAGGLAFDLLSDIRYRTMVIRLDGDLAGEFATRLTVDQVSLGPGHGLVAGLVHRAFSKLPLKLNVAINAPFRALIQMTKAFKDPTQVIAPVMSFPIDSPALKVEVQSMTKQEQPAPSPRRSDQPATQSPPPGGTK